MKKKYKIILLAVIVLFVFYIIYYFHQRDINKIGKENKGYAIKDNSIDYSGDRGEVNYKISFKYSNDSLDIYSVDFQSKNFLNYSTRVHGFLFYTKLKMFLGLFWFLVVAGRRSKKED